MRLVEESDDENNENEVRELVIVLQLLLFAGVYLEACQTSKME